MLALSIDNLEKIALHGLVGGIMAEINGGKFGDGLTTAAINEILVGELSKLKKPLKDENGNIIKDKDGNPIKTALIPGDLLQWISAGVGGAIGGNQGAGIADSATKYNYLTHKQLEEKKNALNGCEERGDRTRIEEYYDRLDKNQDAVWERNEERTNLTKEEYLDLDYELRKNKPVYIPDEMHDRFMIQPIEGLEYIRDLTQDTHPGMSDLLNTVITGNGQSIYYDYSAPISQTLANSNDMKAIVLEMVEINEVSSINKSLPVSMSDAFAAVGTGMTVTIKSTYVDSQGRTVAVVEVSDKYDFDGFLNASGYSDIVNYGNNLGHLAQLQGKVKPFSWAASFEVVVKF